MSKKANFFWASYADLMTSLFFIMLVLFVLTVVMLKRQARATEEELKKIQEIASAIDGQELIIPIKVGEEGQLFESITAQKISEKLKELKFDIKKNQIGLIEPIKELGEFPVKIKLEHNLEAEIKVIVVEEK